MPDESPLSSDTSAELPQPTSAADAPTLALARATDAPSLRVGKEPSTMLAAIHALEGRSVTRLQRSDEWLRLHRLYVFTLLLLTGGIIRSVYIYEIAKSPLLWQQRWTASDMCYFDSWAKQISDGDILSRSVTHPLNSWRVSVADAFLSRHPDEKRVLDPRGLLTHTDLLRKLWDRWCPPLRFYQDPLYPYFLAAIYSLVGAHPLPVFIVQAVFGLSGVCLIYAIATRAFGETVGVLSALLMVWSPPLLVFDAVLLRENLVIFFGLLVVFALQRPCNVTSCSVAGLVIGLSWTLKSHFMLMCIAAIIWISFTRKDGVRQRVRHLAVLAIGLVIGLSPMIVRNVVVGVPGMAPPTSGYFTFIGANSPDYPGEGFYVSPNTCPELIDESRGNFLSAIGCTLRSHPDTWSIVRGVMTRLERSWHWREIPNNTNLYYYQLHSKTLSLMPVTFALIAPAAVVGMLLALPRWRAAWPLYALVFTNVTVLLLFFVMDRYRAPLTAALVPFAAFALVTLCQQLWARRWRNFFMSLATLLIVAVLVVRPDVRDRSTITLNYVSAPFEYFYLPKISKAVGRNDYGAAGIEYDKFLAVVPPFVNALSTGRGTLLPGDIYAVEMVEYYRRAYAAAAVIDRNAGRLSAAEKYENRARWLDISLRRR
jgi:4-amino-4-deoxy-L-arabinose transferase-like glycosyltransferase